MIRSGNYILYANHDQPEELARFVVTADNQFFLMEVSGEFPSDLLPSDGPIDRNDARDLFMLDHHPHYFILSAMRKSEDLSKADAVPKAQQVAENYAASKNLKLKPLPKVKVDPEKGSKIAEAYEAMPHQPNHPDVKASYNALIGETGDQFKHIMNSGLKLKRIKPGEPNPYPNGSKDMFHDIQHNHSLSYFPTEGGFGSGGEENADHPMLRPTEFEHEGKPLLANDLFRIVHDYMGHATGGHSFGPSGEENAYRQHKQMYSPAAHDALTAETRGQNSWVNFGKYGEFNRKNPAQTIYAPQKSGILPKWAKEDY